ncbi:MAG: DNA alkylation repair protein [Caulobacteraceae bacterium]
MSSSRDLEAERLALLNKLRASARPYRGGQANDSYTGSMHPFFNVSVPELRRLAREWLADHRKGEAAVVLAMVDRLFEGESHEEKVLAALMLGASAQARRLAGPQEVDRWLGSLAGWAEIDSLCASVFGPEEMAADWPAWEALIRLLAASSDINRRRGGPGPADPALPHLD